MEAAIAVLTPNSAGTTTTATSAASESAPPQTNRRRHPLSRRSIVRQEQDLMFASEDLDIDLGGAGQGQGQGQGQNDFDFDNLPKKHGGNININGNNAIVVDEELFDDDQTASSANQTPSRSASTLGTVNRRGGILGLALSSGNNANNNNGGNRRGNGKNGRYSYNSAGINSNNSSSNSNNNTDAREARNIFYSKVLVLTVLILTAAAVTTGAYIFTEQEEYSDFESSFDAVGHDILETALLNAQTVRQAFQSFGLSVTSSAMGMGAIWPEMTIPNFGPQAEQLRNQTNSITVSFAPLVYENHRALWERYSVNHQHQWLPQRRTTTVAESSANKDNILSSTRMSSGSLSDASVTFDPDTITSYIWRTESNATNDLVDSPVDPSIVARYDLPIPSVSAEARVRENRRPDPYYAPIWQTSPIPEHPGLSHINRNAYDFPQFSAIFPHLKSQGGTILASIFNLLPSADSTSFIEPTELIPLSIILTPIYETTAVVSDMVGVVMGTIPWQVYFENILPQDTAPVDVVVRSDGCHQEEFSFRIDGPNATYLGPSDLHDETHDHLELNVDFRIATMEGCNYTVHAYPSAKFRENFSTHLPLVYTLASVIIFLSASIVFMIYDWTVERRTHTLKSRAARTSALVNSLFPANVRDRLMDDNNADFEGTNPDDSNSLRRHESLRLNGLTHSGSHHTLHDEPRMSDGVSGVDVTDIISPCGDPDGGGGSVVGSISGPSLHTGVLGDPFRGGSAMMRAGVGSSGMGGAAGVVEPTLAQDASGVFTTKPIADLFPSTTVMFADIVGFTAWSSTREPSQVFTLLETVYNAFDKIAQRRQVFKVETIGDCYVAAAGLPDPRPDHVIIMSRFAHDCLVRMKHVVRSLEVILGPDTAELCMRFGLHSGPVTAGVLRGEKSRFQLFGDTVNTAARIEATGEKNKIHISMESAELLNSFGKAAWIRRRETKVVAKGKGEIQTFWLELQRGKADVIDSHSTVATIVNPGTVTETKEPKMVALPPAEITNAKKVSMDGKKQRLIGWNVDVLRRQLRQILAMRDPSTITASIAIINETDATSGEPDGSRTMRQKMDVLEELSIDKADGATVLDEVREIITLPSEPAAYKINPYSIEFSPQVVSQLTNYVTAIAEMYGDNPFHSFEHASHVTMSVCKLLSRVVTPDSIDYKNMQYTQKQGQAELHKYTYGITSDPITQFACALSALIHDVDHSGVPNAQLVKENADIAVHYKNKSVAEQNSIDLAWELLMEPQYRELRSCIYSSKEELDRFRQLMVNAVMATDIADRELGALRKQRWDKAFDSDGSSSFMNVSELEDSNRKATIVIEHLIQASDVAHTMQHWHIYVKWNERLFQEMYRAYKQGRAETNPAEGWYKGEMGFFDFYLIPLAMKLKECGVFGSASDEYLTYAQANRKEWETKGKEIVAQYVANYEKAIAEGSALY